MFLPKCVSTVDNSNIKIIIELVEVDIATTPFDFTSLEIYGFASRV